MKPIIAGWIFLFSLATPISLWASEGVNDIIRMAKVGVHDEVMLAYIAHSGTPYDPTIEEIEEMQGAGVSARVMVAMIERGDSLRGVANTPENTATPANYTTYSNDDSAPGSAGLPLTTAGTEVQLHAEYIAPETDVDISYFYGSLQPHGTWIELNGYGRVWHPRIAHQVPDWQPYSNGGRWAYTDTGWYWQSDYQWGWAAFHYGRWFRHQPHGWVWAPGTRWAPSWVEWRRNQDYYGWAPLAPDNDFHTSLGISFQSGSFGLNFHLGSNEDYYNFVPANMFLSRDLHRHRVRRDQRRNIYNNTSIIKNSYVYNDNRVINRGFDVDEVQRRTNSRVHRMNVRDMKVEGNDLIRRAEVQRGDDLVVYRPNVRADGRDRSPEEAAKVQETRVRERFERQGVTVEKARERVRSEQAARQKLEARQKQLQNREAQQEERQENRAERREEQQENRTERREEQQKRDEAQQKKQQEDRTERREEQQENRTERREEQQKRDEAQQKKQQEDRTERREEQQERNEARQEKRQDRADDAAAKQRLEQLKEQQEKQKDPIDDAAAKQRLEQLKQQRENRQEKQQENRTERREEQQERNDARQEKKQDRADDAAAKQRLEQLKQQREEQQE